MKNTFNKSSFWVYSTAFLMSFNGGYINSVSLVSALKNAVGYVTGDLTIAGKSLEQGDYFLFLHLIALVLCFLLGSVISGLIIKGQNFKLDRRYNLSLFLQVVTISLAMLLLYFNYLGAGYLLALLMGQQNAMTTHYGSALIRTTHMTGTTTDLGVLISHWIKGYAVPLWKMALYVCLIVGFALGAIGGAFGYAHFDVAALFLSFIVYFAMFVLGWFYSLRSAS